MTCVLCDKPLELRDTQRLGAGHAHTTCALLMSMRLRAAESAVIIVRGEKLGMKIELTTTPRKVRS